MMLCSDVTLTELVIVLATAVTTVVTWQCVIAT